MIKLQQLTLSTLLALLVCGTGLLAEEKEETKKEQDAVVKEISLKGFRIFKRGRFNKPVIIKNAEELAKNISNKKAIEKISKEVDFEKHVLLFFAWAGSGQDRLKAATVKKEGKVTVVFTYRPGLTRDLRPHTYLFAIKKGTKWSIQRGKFGR